MPDETTPATGAETTETTAETTPTELGDAGKQALQREREARRKAEADAKTNADAARRLAEIEESQKTETQKLTDRFTAAEAQRADAELRALRLEVALEKAPEGVALDVIRQAAKRLTGTTREELEADADELFPIFVTEAPNDQKPPTLPERPRRSGSQPVIPIGDDNAIAAALKQKLGIR